MIYSVQADYRCYQVFVLDHKEVRNALGGNTQFHFSREPKSYSTGWVKFEIKFDALGSNASSLPDISVRNGRLFFNESAASKLFPIIATQGEFLPIAYGDENGTFFNVSAVAEEFDALDTRCSAKNEYGEIQSIGFHENKLGSIHLFRAEFDGYMGVYCTETFKKTVEENDLKGVVFNCDIGNGFPAINSVNTNH